MRIMITLLLLSLLFHISRACTTFCMDTPDGPVFGANFDHSVLNNGLAFINKREIAKQGFKGSTTGDTLKWVSKYGSITFNLVGREFAFGGMNEAGLVVGSMELRASKLAKPDHRPSLSMATWVQYILDICGNIDEVITVLPAVRIEDVTTPAHYLISDAKGNCVAVEWLDGKLVFYSGNDLPVKAMSNVCYGRAAYAFEEGGKKWLWSNPGRSYERFTGAAVRNIQYNAQTEPDAVKYAFGTLTKVVVAHNTQWNIVYHIAKREIWYRSKYSPAVKHLAFRSFDFSPDTPIQMLEVNASVEGDVHPHFIPYDRDINLKVFLSTCRMLGVQIAMPEAIRLMDLFDKFKPVKP